MITQLIISILHLMLLQTSKICMKCYKMLKPTWGYCRSALISSTNSTGHNREPNRMFPVCQNKKVNLIDPIL